MLRFDAEQLYLAARLYYLGGVSQAGVAAELGVSRTTVSRLLAEARRVGVVTINVQRVTSRGRRSATDGPPDATNLRR